MTKRFTHKLFVLGATTCIVASCNSANGQNLSSSIVRIQGSAMPGSGVVVRQNGNLATVWTVAHVIGNPKGSVEITEANGKKTQAKIISYSKEKDIAILEFEPTKYYGNIKTTSASPEEDVTVVGFPNRLNLNSSKPEIFKSPSGFIFGQWDKSQSNYNVAYKATTLPGMSGGGVFNKQGELVAIHALKDIRQAERKNYCYGGKTEDTGAIGLGCLSATPSFIQGYEQTNKYYQTIRSLGSRGIGSNRFDNLTSNQQSTSKADIPHLLDSYQDSETQAYELIVKILPNIGKKTKPKKLSQDQKIAALIYYNNFSPNTPPSPQYQNYIITALPDTNRAKIDNLLIEKASLFHHYGRNLGDQYGNIDTTSKAYRDAESKWWNNHRATAIDACIANGGTESSCDPLQYTSENINEIEVYTDESLQRLKKEITTGTADSDTYLYAASILVYSNKNIEKALEYAIKAEELGSLSATNLVEDLAKRTGDYDALLISKYNRIASQLEIIATQPSLKADARRNIWGLLPLKELENSASGCEIGNEINSLLTDANVAEQINPYSYKQFSDALKTACSTKKQAQNTTAVASASKTLQTLSDLGIKLPENAKELMTLPTNIPGVVGQNATHPTNKSVEAIYQEMTTSAKSNGFKLIKGLTRSGLPYSGGSSGCRDIGQKMCTATFTNINYGEDHWFTLMITEMPGTDSINIQSSVMESMAKRDPLFKVIYDQEN